MVFSVPMPPTTPRSEDARGAVGWSHLLTPGLFGGFGIVVIVLIATLVVGLANLRNVYGTGDAVAHTYALKVSLEQLLTTTVDAEAGERGFLITGELKYLEPYNRARAAVSTNIAQLRALLADNGEHQADLDRLSAALDVKFGELAEAIRLRRESGFAAAQAQVVTNLGERTMDGMRIIVARMNAREDALLAIRIGQAAQGYRAAVVTRFVTTGLALLAVIGLFVVTIRFGVERRRTAQTAERFRVTLASIGDAVIATDDQGKVTQLNAVAEALTGWMQADAAGRRIEDVFVIINEESRQPAESPIRRVLREGAIVELANHTVLLSKDGREIPVDDSAGPIKTAGSQVAGVVMVFRDVTERRRTEQQRAALLDSERLAKRDAETANRAKDEFLAMVSHELRTPLNAVLGWADMLRSGTLSEARRERAIEAVHTNASRQRRLIDELLDISRAMSGKMRLERTVFDLPDAVRAALDVVQPAADAKHVRLIVDAAPSIGSFYADATRLQQILWNLLSNAVKFTPEGGTVDIRLRRVDGVVECVVTDTGPGIPADFLPSVFDPFRQADGSTTRRHGGLGLGLSIVKHLVEAHGGTVSADNVSGGYGATFLVRLPVVPIYTQQPDAAAIASPPATEPPAPNGVPVSLLGVSVLVVDDDADSRESVAANLEQQGAVVHTAASTAEALERLKTERVDVLISDVAMPDEDGYALIRRIRALEQPDKAAIPAAALTSLARAEDWQQALQAGFQVPSDETD